MKRSEMIEILAEYLEWFENQPDFTYLYGADKLLNLIEETGMIPPRTPLDALKGYSDNAWKPEKTQLQRDVTCRFCSSSCGNAWCPTINPKKGS